MDISNIENRVEKKFNDLLNKLPNNYIYNNQNIEYYKYNNYDMYSSDSNTITSNNTSNNLNENTNYIEKEIERKFNDVLSKLPLKKLKENKEDIEYYNYNIYDIYQNMMQTIIDIITEIIQLIDDSKYIENNIFYNRLYSIFFNEKRIFYLGIIFIILSFIIYFIDGASI